MLHPRSLATHTPVRLLLVVACALPATPLPAQEADWSYVIGGRTTFLATSIQLGDLSPYFDELTPGGKALTHASSLFIMWRRTDHVRAGVETIAGNTYGGVSTRILFQGAGATVEYQTRGDRFLAFGAVAGGMIVSATQDFAGTDPDATLHVGHYYQGSGLFLAPSIAVGDVMDDYDVRIMARVVLPVAGSAGITEFGAAWVGFSIGRRR